MEKKEFVVWTGGLFSDVIAVCSFCQGIKFIRHSSYYLYTNQLTTELVIFSTGTAKVTAGIEGVVGTVTSVQVNAYLQRYSGGSWVTVDSWSQSSNPSRTTLLRNISVVKGYPYRVQASYYAYSGSEYEHLVRYSPVVWY